MSAILFYLLHNPSALKRLEHEVRSTFSNTQDIRTGPALHSCTWLRACIDETMRMTPAVPGLLPREILPGGLDIVTLDLYLPPGIDVGVPIYAIHHHGDFVSEPFKFDPTRWLSEGADREALGQVFCPFSLGHRSCLGKPLVYMELGIAVARLVWEFDMRLAGGLEGELHREDSREYVVKDYFLAANESVQVEFRERQTIV